MGQSIVKSGDYVMMNGMAYFVTKVGLGSSLETSAQIPMVWLEHVSELRRGFLWRKIFPRSRMRLTELAFKLDAKQARLIRCIRSEEGFDKVSARKANLSGV